MLTFFTVAEHLKDWGTGLSEPLALWSPLPSARSLRDLSFYIPPKAQKGYGLLSDSLGFSVGLGAPAR